MGFLLFNYLSFYKEMFLISKNFSVVKIVLNLYNGYLHINYLFLLLQIKFSDESNNRWRGLCLPFAQCSKAQRGAPILNNFDILVKTGKQFPFMITQNLMVSVIRRGKYTKLHFRKMGSNNLDQTTRWTKQNCRFLSKKMSVRELKLSTLAISFSP